MLLRFIKLGIILIVFSSINFILFAKEDRNGEGKIPNDSQKQLQGPQGKNRNTLEKEIKTNSKDDEDDFSRNRGDKKFDDPIREKIGNGIDETENIINQLKHFQRNISQSNDFNMIKKQYAEIVKEIEIMNSKNNVFFSSLDNALREDVSGQLKVIEDSRKTLESLAVDIGNDLKIKNTDKKNISIKCRELEKEINKINKQYRAIEWLLYER